MHNEFDNDRGQVGIWTLIVFIAVVLVASIAAGVLINTAGFQPSKSERTGQQSSAQVSDRLQAVTTTGQVDDTEDTISDVNVTVKIPPGGTEVDLTNATVTWIGPSGTYRLVHDDVTGSGADGNFNVTTFKDSDGSLPVLNHSDDRATMNFNANDLTGGASTGITEGTDVTVEITTMSGGSTTVRLDVPESLSGTNSVRLS